MQEIHSIENGRNLFNGENRRLNPHHQNTQPTLNCPRCNSLNTKFCYYNNYNLSQPRHFCKNCRRYWTKGGVLRNVPVGGGSRKTKRSNKPNNKKPPPSTTSETTPITIQPPQPLPERKSNSHSSSESSTLTAAAATEAISAPASIAASNLFSVIHEQVGGDNNFGILTSNNVLNASSFCFGKLPQQLHGYSQVHVARDSASLEGYPTTSFADQVMHTPYGGFGSLDWNTGVGQSLFDLPNTVDQSYWTNNLHWPGYYNSTLFHLP